MKTPDDTSVATPANGEWAEVVIKELELKNKKKEEIFYSHQARMLALKRDPDGAFRSAIECSEKEVAEVKLRTYTPALAAYARAGMYHTLLYSHHSDVCCCNRKGTKPL